MKSRGIVSSLFFTVTILSTTNLSASPYSRNILMIPKVYPPIGFYEWVDAVGNTVTGEGETILYLGFGPLGRIPLARYKSHYYEGSISKYMRFIIISFVLGLTALTWHLMKKRKLKKLAVESEEEC